MVVVWRCSASPGAQPPQENFEGRFQGGVEVVQQLSQALSSCGLTASASESIASESIRAPLKHGPSSHAGKTNPTHDNAAPKDCQAVS